MSKRLLNKIIVWKLFGTLKGTWARTIMGRVPFKDMPLEELEEL